MLTEKQSELLRFIHARLQKTGVPPSFDEMKDALDLKSKSGIHRLIMALEERGFIRRLPNRARALEVLRLPEQAAARALAEGAKPKGFSPTVVTGGRPAPKPRVDPPSRDFPGSYDIPVMGRIAAGTPISAIQTPSHTISMSADFLASGEHFALEVRGDSMIDAGILDNDTVIIRRQDDANTGDIVVALVDDEEATLKRLRRRGKSIALEPANAAYETRIFGPERIKVQGILVSLFRRY